VSGARFRKTELAPERHWPRLGWGRRVSLGGEA